MRSGLVQVAPHDRSPSARRRRVGQAWPRGSGDERAHAHRVSRRGGLGAGVLAHPSGAPFLSTEFFAWGCFSVFFRRPWEKWAGGVSAEPREAPHASVNNLLTDVGVKRTATSLAAGGSSDRPVHDLGTRRFPDGDRRRNVCGHRSLSCLSSVPESRVQKPLRGAASVMPPACRRVGARALLDFGVGLQDFFGSDPGVSRNKCASAFGRIHFTAPTCDGEVAPLQHGRARP